MTAAAALALLTEAEACGARLRAAGPDRVKVSGEVPPDLLARLRERKTELAALLRGDVCRHCGEPMGWPGPVGIRRGDGIAEHTACYDAAEVARIRARAENAFSADALADPAELCVRGEPLP